MDFLMWLVHMLVQLVLVNRSGDELTDLSLAPAYDHLCHAWFVIIAVLSLAHNASELIPKLLDCSQSPAIDELYPKLLWCGLVSVQVFLRWVVAFTQIWLDGVIHSWLIWEYWVCADTVGPRRGWTSVIRPPPYLNLVRMDIQICACGFWSGLRCAAATLERMCH